MQSHRFNETVQSHEIQSPVFTQRALQAKHSTHYISYRRGRKLIALSRIIITDTTRGGRHHLHPIQEAEHPLSTNKASVCVCMTERDGGGTEGGRKEGRKGGREGGRETRGSRHTPPVLLRIINVRVQPERLALAQRGWLFASSTNLLPLLAPNNQPFAQLVLAPPPHFLPVTVCFRTRVWGTGLRRKIRLALPANGQPAALRT